MADPELRSGGAHQVDQEALRAAPSGMWEGDVHPPPTRRVWGTCPPKHFKKFAQVKRNIDFKGSSSGSTEPMLTN